MSELNSTVQRVIPPDCGILLVGHGSREERGMQEFLATAELVARQIAPAPCEPCFLEFAAPDIAAGFRRLAASGVRRIVVVPVLLFAAGHAKRDIPEAVAQVTAEFPYLEVRQAAHLGCEANLLELSRLRFAEAVGETTELGRQAESTSLVLVGRGSLDNEATVEMHRFAQLRAAGLPQECVEVGFVAMARPPLAEVLERVGSTTPARVVVQPHLLFAGVLLDRIGQMVDQYAARFTQTRWLTAAHLGPAPPIASALLTRAAETLSR